MDPTAPSEPRGPAARSSPRHARTVETHATAAAAAEAAAAEAAAAEAELLPDGLGPPACVALWGAVAAAGLKPALDKETEQQGALRWLERALDCAHLSARIKRHAQALLSSRRFTPNMAYMGLFGPLQSHCRASLLRLGGPLRRRAVTAAPASLPTLRPILTPAPRARRTVMPALMHRRARRAVPTTLSRTAVALQATTAAPDFSLALRLIRVSVKRAQVSLTAAEPPVARLEQLSAARVIIATLDFG